MIRWGVSKDKRRKCLLLVLRSVTLSITPSSVSDTVQMMKSCVCMLRLGVESNKKLKDTAKEGGA